MHRNNNNNNNNDDDNHIVKYKPYELILTNKGIY